MPTSTVDQFGQSFTITGLSGLSALPDGRFVAVMDNSNKLVVFRPVFSADGGITAVTDLTGVTMSQTRDFEDVAWLPGTNSALICDEGATGPLSVVDLATGALSAGPSMPAVFANVRSNFGLESLTVSTDGLTAWTCNEESLAVDGQTSTPQAGTRVRLQKFTRFSGTGTGGFVASGQWCYLTQSMHGSNISSGRSGVSALVALPGGGLLALERSFAMSASGLFNNRMYSVSTATATETSAMPALASEILVLCTKFPRYSGYLNNLEGLALGPLAPAGPGVPTGRRLMLGITDDGNPFAVGRLHVFFLDGLVTTCGPADLGAQGGVFGGDGLLDNNDFIAFINAYFLADPGADLGQQGGELGGDGLFDNNDFIAFINHFFNGC